MTQVDRTTFKNNTATLYADNSTGNIGAGDLRAQMNDIADSTIFKSTGYTAAPTANDDDNDTAGNGVFAVGDVWIDESNNKAYICVDASTGTAIWEEITFTDTSALTTTAVPASQELAVWVNDTTLRGFTELTWDDSADELNLTGNLVVSGTVDGRDIAADGTKLDGIPTDAISALEFSDIDVSTGVTTDYNIKTLEVRTQNGLKAESINASTIRLGIDIGNVTAVTANRALEDDDSNTYITNTGASGAIKLTLPLTAGLTSKPFVAAFFKDADQEMRLVGATNVRINGVLELGGEESLVTICDKPHDSIAYAIFSGTTNEWFVVETSNTLVEFNEQTGTAYTLALSDRNKVVTMSNSSSNTLTIPNDSTTDFPNGTKIRVIQIDSGITTISAATGVILNSVSGGSVDITAQWDEVRLYKVRNNEWYVTGQIGTVV